MCLRYDTVLFPFICVVQFPGCPVIPVPDGFLSSEISALPNISTSFPPKMLKMGTPKSEIGVGREIPEIL